MSGETAKKTALDTLLQHPQLWRASCTPPGQAGVRGEAGDGTQGNTDARSHANCSGIAPTGFRQLDALLHCGGWPLGNLVECLSPPAKTRQAQARQGIGQGALQLFLPALQQLPSLQSRAANALAQPVVLVAPPHIPYLPGWPLAGSHNNNNAALPPLWVVTPRNEADLLWASEQVLQSNSAGAVFIWLAQSRQLRTVQLRKLQLAARQSESLVVVFRETAALQQPSPAPLRLVVSTAASAQGVPLAQLTQLQVHIAKQPGGWGGQHTGIGWHSRLQRPVIPAVRWPVHQPAGYSPHDAPGESPGSSLPLLGTRATRWS